MIKVVGLKEIAESVGVSVSTVSKAINNATDVSEDTRQRILQAAAGLGYRLEKASLSCGAPRTIGIICPEINSNYYAQILSVLEGDISRKGYYATVAFTNFLYENEKRALIDFIGQKVAGIILITEGHEIGSDLVALKGKIKFPLIVIAYDMKSADHDNLLIDDSIGIEMAVDHLTGLGHTEIGFISDSLTLERLRHFRAAMESRNLSVNEGNVYIEREDKRFEACGYAGAAAIIGGGAGITALIGGYDDIAIGALRLLSERGLRVPEDISVVGVDDVSVTPYLPVSLTTVAVPLEEMAEIATKILIRKLRDPGYQVVQQVFLRPRLIVRESTGSRA